MSITKRQFFWILFAFEVGNTLLISLTPTASFARQNMWICYAAGGVFAILIALVAARVGLFHPDRNFLENCRMILGKWPGTFVVFLYLIHWFSTISIILNDFTDFINTVMLPRTPWWVFTIVMLLLVVYAMYAGQIRGVGRSSEFFGPIIVVSLLLIFFLLIPEAEFHRLLPVFVDTGFRNIAVGSVFPYALLGEGVFLMALVPFLEQPERAAAAAFRGVAVSVVFVLIVVIFVIMTLGGELPAILKNPTLITISYINAMNFLQNLEIVGVLVWVISIFVKLSVYLFLVSYHTGQLFKARNWRWISWPVALGTFILTYLFVNFSIDGHNIMVFYWTPVVTPLHLVVLPLLLWIVGAIRSRKRRT